MTPLSERLWSRVVPGENGCLVWTGAQDPFGYGRIGIRATETDLTHRVSFALARGPIRDMVSKGRHPSIVHPDRLARSHQTVRRIGSGIGWRHVTMPGAKT